MHTIRPLQQTMDLIRTLLSRVTSLFFTRKLDADLDEELRTHIDLAIEENLDRGMSQQQARTAALRSFGGVTQIYERYREQRGIPLLEQMKRDIRFGLRQLRRSPGFAVTAILTLALGVGANTAIFTLIDSIILRPLPYPDQDRLVNISAGGFFPKGWIRALQQNSQSFASISAYGLNAESNIAGRDSAERVFGSRVTVNTFDTLVACRSEVVTDEGAFHKFISIAALHTATQHLACPLTLSLRQATRMLTGGAKLTSFREREESS